MVAAVKGYKLILVMPESMSLERRRLMLAYGASFDLTPREKGMKGAIERAERAARRDRRTAGCRSSSRIRPIIEVHRRTTAQEILADFRDAPIDVLITGVGTGGHITACAEVLKKAWPSLKVFAVEPTLSPVISGGQPGPHPIQGIGAGFIPANLDTEPARRRHPGRSRRRQGNGAPRRARGRHAGRHQLGRDAGGHQAANCPSSAPARASSASTTIPASAISRCRLPARRGLTLQTLAVASADC